MSVRTMAKVWEGSGHGGAELLMLLAIADFADDDGRAYPSISTLAAKCRTKPRYAMVLLDKLGASGELMVLRGQGPMGRGGRTNVYRVVFDRLTRNAGEVVHGSALVNPSAVVHQDAGSSAPGFREVVNQGAPKPSRNHQEPPSQRRGKRAAENVGVPDVLPDWVPADAWKDYVDMRRTLKKPMTPAAVRLMVNKLEKLRDNGHDPRAVLEQSTANSWQGLFELKAASAGRTNGGHRFKDVDYEAGVERAETTYQRSMRERVEQAAPMVAAKAPGAARTIRPNPMEVLDGLVKRVD